MLQIPVDEGVTVASLLHTFLLRVERTGLFPLCKMRVEAGSVTLILVR